MNGDEKASRPAVVQVVLIGRGSYEHDDAQIVVLAIHRSHRVVIFSRVESLAIAKRRIVIALKNEKRG